MQIDPDGPSELGEYRLLEFIGSGGMGEVWLAGKEGLARPRALKILAPELARDEEYRRRFFREAQIGAGLRHARIAAVHDFGEARGLLYLVMDFIDGIDLAGFCRALVEGGEQMPMEAVAYVIGEVFEALHYAHTRTVAARPCGVIHRDVTPRNVMISSAGEVFLTDFGIARYEADLSGESETFGTVKYMAPEQARGRAYFESDIYGGAGVLHFMLTTEAPRRVTPGNEPVPSLDAPPPSTGRDDVPEPLERLRVVGLEPEVGRRIATANDALTIIDSWTGYRKANRILAQLYRRFIGKPRSGMSGLLEMAKAEQQVEGETRSVAMAQGAPPRPVESAQMTVKVRRDDELAEPEPEEPKRPDDDEVGWNRPWWRADEDETTRRFLRRPPEAEPDAPRILRRPRRRNVDPSLDVEHLPGIPLGSETKDGSEPGEDTGREAQEAQS